MTSQNVAEFQNMIQSESKFIHFNMNFGYNNTFSNTSIASQCAYLDHSIPFLHKEVQPIEIYLCLADRRHCGDGRVAILQEAKQSLEEHASVGLVTEVTDLIQDLVLARLLLEKEQQV